jgi:hypothetical protein
MDKPGLSPAMLRLGGVALATLLGVLLLLS